MGVYAEARDVAGRRVSFDDPSGGTFDAAGDFDRLIPANNLALPTLSAVDPDAVEPVPVDRLPELALEVEAIRGDARPGPEQRGLDRLAVLISECGARADLTLVFVGD
jgi:hypothetical protein